MKSSKPRKIIKISEDLEASLLHAIVKGIVAPDVVTPEELSKSGRLALASCEALTPETRTFHSVLLHAVEVLGAPSEAMGDYMGRVSASEAGSDASVILSKVRDKQVLIELINEAGTQLSRGSLDLALLGGVLQRDTGSTYTVSPVSEIVKDGLPPTPTGQRLRSLPILSAKTGGLYGMWAIAGEPGVGKSALAWQIALDVAPAIPTLYYDFENGFEVMMDHTRQIFQDDLNRLRSATSRIYYRDNIRTLDADLLSVPSPALIIIDSVQKLPTSFMYHKQGLDKWVHRLEYLKKRGYYVLLVSEVPRSQYNADAYIGAFKETGEIEYAANLGLQLLPVPPNGDIVEVQIVKNRHRPYKGFAVNMKRDEKRVWVWKEITDNVAVPQGEEID